MGINKERRQIYYYSFLTKEKLPNTWGGVNKPQIQCFATMEMFCGKRNGRRGKLLKWGQGESNRAPAEMIRWPFIPDERRLHHWSQSHPRQPFSQNNGWLFLSWQMIWYRQVTFFNQHYTYTCFQLHLVHPSTRAASTAKWSLRGRGTVFGCVLSYPV